MDNKNYNVTKISFDMNKLKQRKVTHYTKSPRTKNNFENYMFVYCSEHEIGDRVTISEIGQINHIGLRVITWRYTEDLTPEIIKEIIKEMADIVLKTYINRETKILESLDNIQKDIGLIDDFIAKL